MERKTRLELATLTLARLCSTNWAISAFLHSRVVFSFADAKVDLFFESPKLFGVFFRNVCGSSFPMGVEGWSGRGLCGWFSVGYFHEESRQGGAGFLFDFYTPMQDVTPKVVAMAVSTVITMFRIFPQMFLFSISDLWFMISFFFFLHHRGHGVFNLAFRMANNYSVRLRVTLWWIQFFFFAPQSTLISHRMDVISSFYCVILSIAKDLFTSTRQGLRCVYRSFTSFRMTRRGRIIQ